VVEFGLIGVFKNVRRTGVPEHHPVAFDKDERIEGWRENYVYKLPSGKILAIYHDITDRKRTEKEKEKLIHLGVWETRKHGSLQLDNAHIQTIGTELTGDYTYSTPQKASSYLLKHIYNITRKT
jgi:hypothetical protein